MSARSERFRLPKELQYAAAAAAALVLSFVLPWYQKTEVINGRLSQVNVSALGAFTFVEGAILLVAVAVGFLVWMRARQKGFHLPGGDGVAITLAGAWCVLLVVFRMFDQPDDAGIQWGLFGAFVAAGALIATGARIRQVHAPEPPNPAADDAGWVHVPRRERERPPERRPRDATAVTELLRERPEWEGEAPTTRLDESPTTRLPDASEAPTRRRRGDEPTQRLFEDD
jgi:hypothetical protein